MNTWNPTIRIMRDNSPNPWRVELGDGIITATSGLRNKQVSADVDEFCAELRRAVDTAHRLNLEGDAT